MTKLRKLGIQGATILILFVLFSLSASNAFAHANLTKTTPVNGSVASVTPESVTLQFSEPLEPDLIGLKLYDWNGRALPLDKPRLVSGKPDEMTALLPRLEDGTYTVAWSVISEDGHPVNGNFSFSVGAASESVISPTTSTMFQHGYEISLIVLRYAVEGLLLLSAGLYGLAYAARRYSLPPVRELLGQNARRILWGLLLLLTIGEWLVYSANLPGGGMNAVLLQGHWNVVFESPFATMLLVQAALLLGLALRGMHEIWSPMILTLLVANLAFGGHARGIQPEWLALSLRVLHLLVIALWLGGLSYLALTIRYEQVRGGTLDRTKFRPFFVRAMIIAATLTTLTGIAMTEVQTDWLSVLLFEGGLWGNLLWLKVFLLLVMILIALAQTMRWKQDDRKLSFDMLRMEWLVGILVIQVAIFLSQMAYPTPIRPYHETLASQQIQADVQIPKLMLGQQTMTFTLSEAPQEVKVYLKMMDMEMGDLELKPVKKDDHYEVDIPFTMTGDWRYTLDATYPNDQHVTWVDTLLIPQGGQLR